LQSLHERLRSGEVASRHSAGVGYGDAVCPKLNIEGNAGAAKGLNFRQKLKSSKSRTTITVMTTIVK
jgi:hypothetical protein